MAQHIAIVGGGITGLATAFYLQSEIENRGLPLRYTVVEASHRWGGLIDTVRKNGFVIEKGPDSFLERKKYATQLCVDLGLEDELVHNQVGQAYIYHDHQLHPVPQGSVMGIPTDLTSFLKTKLLSTEGKARGLEDLLLSPSVREEDQSVGAFLRQRFGDELVNRIIEPLVSGVYGSPIEELSLEATYPQYPMLLKRYGSLIKAFKDINASTKPSKGIFQTVKSGLYTMVEKLIQQLPSYALRTNHVLTKLTKSEKGYVLHFQNGERITAQSVILTIPFFATKQVLYPVLESNQFEQKAPTSAATVALGFEKGDLDIPYQGTGFIVPKSASLSLTACTWVQKKWPHAVPDGKNLLRCFVGRPGDDQIVNASDKEIVRAVIRDLQQIQGVRIQKEPEFSIVHRLKNVRPAYTVGHTKWVKRVLQQVEKYYPQVYLAGSSYHGIGLPDCIKQGREIVNTIIDSLTKEKKIVIH